MVSTFHVPDAKSRSILAWISMFLALVISVEAGAQNTPHRSPERSRIGSGLGQSELPSGLMFEPRIEGAIQYVENINLATDAANEENATGLELAPGFYSAYNSDRFTGAADYSLIGRVWDDDELDDVSHELAANGRWTAIPALFFIDADASYTDAVIDARRSTNYGGLGIFGAGNLTEQATASISPNLQRRFRELEFAASYSYGRVWYLDSDSVTPSFGVLYQDDSKDQRAYASLGTIDEGRRLTGSVFYSWDRSDFENSLPYEFERAGFDGAWVLTRTFTGLAEVGLESDLDESTTEGGLDSEYWSAGLRWSPDSRTTVEGRYGERFFGESYMAAISHSARLLEFTASYSEAPEVETRQVGLGEFEPGTLPPWNNPGAFLGSFTSSPFISRDARVAVAASGSRTTLRLTGFDMERDYISDLLGDEEGSGVAFDATRELASNASVDFSASYTDYLRNNDLIDSNIRIVSRDYDTEFLVRGNLDFSPRVTSSLEAGYLTRSGSLDYDGWWVALRGRWTPELR